MYIVKFGGSAITDKTKPYTYLRGRISSIAPALRGVRAVLIHGAGSFAHPHVKAYGLTPLGIAYTKAALKRLTSYVIEELAEASVPAMPVEPSDVFWGGDVVRLDPIRHALDNGMYPLLHGDIVPADAGYVVVSGDDMAAALSKTLKPNAVVFLMEADGIYTAPPGTPGAVKIPVLKSAVDVDGTAGVDVTGGVRKKVEAGLAIAALGIPVYYCSIRDRKALEEVVSGGRPESCTAVEP
ncbi:isopentenyl phosphate kinase [Pyrobaculum neutrophilum]|uniref:Isopentenyl phosphate kinase n=1 Tax=Pyrobaculum neutrophilum (strain DSM 2338 / JCM 9278 / NBRC 100436 / V24Sta) TaxID=444157 RepID=B1YAP2_PYRNV|nr:isopentenyl phosphate kinase [Pyrobaculum neutrophilum]ACB39121.1 aspartate/glutamate/uridylate kinase [Pyrobaculum neutrophilum V24Sta]